VWGCFGEERKYRKSCGRTPRSTDRSVSELFFVVCKTFTIYEFEPLNPEQKRLSSDCFAVLLWLPLFVNCDMAISL